MKICSIASGSSGNCVFIGTDTTNILIDTGISGIKIEKGLNKIDVSPKSIDAILVTHEHTDHINGLGVMARRYQIPIYTTKKTWNAILGTKSIGKMNEELFHKITPDEDFIIKDFIIHPFKIFHDAVEPVSYTFSYESKKISVITDSGTYDDYIIEKLKDSNVLFIEANHDIRMVETGSYPYPLKRRILSDIGHLSNEKSGQLICEVLHEKLTHIMLGHLSNENNYPELAYESVLCELQTCLQEKQLDVSVSIAKRNDNSELIII